MVSEVPPQGHVLTVVRVGEIRAGGQENLGPIPAQPVTCRWLWSSPSFPGAQIPDSRSR